MGEYKLYVWRAPIAFPNPEPWHWDIAPAHRREPDANGNRRSVVAAGTGCTEEYGQAETFEQAVAEGAMVLTQY